MRSQRSGRHGRLRGVARWTIGLVACAAAAVALVVAARASQAAQRGDTAAGRSTPSTVTPAARPLGATSPTSSSEDSSVTSTTSRFRAPSSDPLIESVTHDLMGTKPGSLVSLSEPEARCVAFEMVARLGTEALVGVGAQVPPSAPVDISALNPAQQEQFAAALVDCVDVRSILADQFGAAGLSPGDISCVADQLSQDGTLSSVLRQSVLGKVDTATAERELTRPMAEALQRCQPGNEPIRSGRAN